MSKLNEHPQRRTLANELHARPFVGIRAPCEVWHRAMLVDEHRVGEVREHLAGFCRAHAAPLPAEDANHYSHDFGSFTLKWERHTEFVTWTVWAAWDGRRAFERAMDAVVDPVWLESLPGQLLVAVTMAVLGPEQEGAEHVVGRLSPDSLCGSVLGSGSELWTDFRIHADGGTRMILRDRTGDPQPLGRRVQRLLEVETYRTLALLSLPLARETAPHLARAAERLAAITERMAAMSDLADEQGLLHEITSLSTEIERRAAANAYRFSATRAYAALVRERLDLLLVEPLGDLPSIRSFMDRRLSPALRTCESVAEREQGMLAHVARAADLLRTRVDIALEAQNRDLLEAMNRRSRLQLRLQQTVEGLSIVAITYYGAGLVGYAAKAASRAGLPIDAEIAAGVSVPLIAFAVWRVIAHTRRAIEVEEPDPARP
jgi:uncharacterized membrane-anchored protein